MGWRRLAAAAVAAAAIALAGCGGPSPSVASTGQASPTPPATHVPSATAAPPSGPAASIRTVAAGSLVSESGHGLAVTFPSGWIVLVPSAAHDAAAIATMKSRLGSNAGVVDALASALRQDPEEWLTATLVPDADVVTAQLHSMANSDSWPAQEQTLLETTFGSVQTAQLSFPRKGVAFTYQNQGFATRVYGFPRPGGVVVFSFTSSSPKPGSGWGDIVATFSDAER